MGATNLDRHTLAIGVSAVVALTTVGVLAGLVAPGLAGHTAPHPALRGRLSDALAILQNNLRVLATPFLLWRLRFSTSRLGRHAGDFLIAALSMASALPVGLELGRWRGRLLPYVPQLPLEWTALAIAIAVWLALRNGHNEARRLALAALAIVLLLCAAAGLETWATPHLRPRARISRAAADGVRDRLPLGTRRLPSPRIVRRPRPLACKVARSLPLTKLGSARPLSAGAARAPSTHRPPRRDHMNTVQLTARLTRDPEVRSLESGNTVANLRVAVQRPRKNGTDEGADYVDITAWGALAETCGRYLSKGRKVAIEGHLHHSEWDSDNGRRSRLEVVARSIEFLESGRRDEEPAAQAVGTSGESEDITF